MKTKQDAVKKSLEQCLKWEEDTLNLYQQLHKELITLNKIADSEKIKELIIDVQCEIKDITQYQLNKISTNYDMINIIEQQDKII